MTTFLQQLLAEYEASTQGEWEVYFESLPQDDKIWYVFVRDGDRPADECTSVFDCSYVAWEGGGHPPEPADTRFILSAHNKMPLLLAVAEAAADVVAWHGTVQDLFRKEARGDEVSVSEMSRANSEWSDAMDRLSAALAVEEAQ